MILVDRKIATESYTAYVGANNYQIGKEAGLYAIGVLKGKGNIAEVRGTKGSTSDAERHKGFVDALAKAPEISDCSRSIGATICLMKLKSSCSLYFSGILI